MESTIFYLFDGRLLKDSTFQTFATATCRGRIVVYTARESYILLPIFTSNNITTKKFSILQHPTSRNVKDEFHTLSKCEVYHSKIPPAHCAPSPHPHLSYENSHHSLNAHITTHVIIALSIPTTIRRNHTHMRKHNKDIQ